MIILGHGEQVLRDWKYAEINQGKDSLGKTLTVTNRRIIVSEQSGQSVTRNEIAVNRVAGLQTHYTYMKEDKKRQGIFFLVVGILFAVLFISIAIAAKAPALWAGLAVALIFIGIAIYCLLYKKVYGQLVVVFQTMIPSNTLRYGLSAEVLPDELPVKSAAEFTIQVDLNVAREIVDTLGSVILVR
ncbi:MAG: hypothetical protein NC131_04665 [Roseburia sp.]|nr:hypothetical protein [Roseburia sp.]